MEIRHPFAVDVELDFKLSKALVQHRHLYGAELARDLLSILQPECTLLCLDLVRAEVVRLQHALAKMLSVACRDPKMKLVLRAFLRVDEVCGFRFH